MCVRALRRVGWAVVAPSMAFPVVAMRWRICAFSRAIRACSSSCLRRAVGQRSAPPSRPRHARAVLRAYASMLRAWRVVRSPGAPARRPPACKCSRARRSQGAPASCTNRQHGATSVAAHSRSEVAERVAIGTCSARRVFSISEATHTAQHWRRTRTARPRRDHERSSPRSRSTAPCRSASARAHVPSRLARCRDLTSADHIL